MRQKLLLAITVVTSLAATSCKENKIKVAKQPANPIEATNQSAEKQIIENKIVTATVTDNNGARLDMTFYNSKGTATFLLNGERIEMKQDTMGSGVKYSNEKYEYTEWHGRIEIKKLKFRRSNPA